LALKSVSREEAARKKQQAADFMDRIGEGDRAAEFDSMSVDEYVQHRGLTLTNPNNRRRTCYMPSNSPTKSDLQEQLDSIEEILDSAYQVESSREEMAQAISQALDILQEGENEDEDEDVDDDDNGD
jgi:hypothetical protein